MRIAFGNILQQYQHRAAQNSASFNQQRDRLKGETLSPEELQQVTAKALESLGQVVRTQGQAIDTLAFYQRRQQERSGTLRPPNS